MARPRKQTVDYFPHSCNHGQTIFILEQKYQQIGYTFWFKLLEELGKREGHYVDCRNPSTLEFLQAKTFTDEKTCLEMLNLLSKLEAIDPELWQENVIWCQKFVDGIADVYKNRRVEIPTRPSFYRQKPHQAEVSTDRNPQSKVKETKGKKMKEKKTLAKAKEGKPSKYEDGSKIILLPEERMSQSDERDRSFPRKRTWGDEKIDWTLDYLEFKLDRKLSGQEKWNRIYARHLANKIGMGKVKVLIDWMTQPDCWWFDKIGQVATIYKNVEKLLAQMETPKEKAKGKTIEELTISAKNL